MSIVRIVSRFLRSLAEPDDAGERPSSRKAVIVRVKAAAPSWWRAG